ncbi:hypothetical protein [Pseudonocardia spinosispora]|uniref:hypothetical protein n=1 Tax=Pseudonocardia spinosispora TaxID=103441 RepID=UPI001B7F9F57|nr:hypothetical protein [Pseudonocardia spinosispora]
MKEKTPGKGLRALKGLGGVVAAPPARLGMVRLLIGGYTFYYLRKRRDAFHRLNRTDPALFAPVGPVRVLRKPIPAPVADALNDATLVSTALFALGAGHKVVGPVHSSLLSWTLSYRNSWSMIFHSDNSLVMHSIVLGATRAADAVSVDALLSSAKTPEPHKRYGWPLQLMNAVSTAVYLLSGVSKVAGPLGWSWAKGSSMRRQVAVDGVRKEVFGSEAPAAAYATYKHEHLFTAFAAGSLAMELGAPLGLINRKFGKLMALALFGMHWGIRVIMGIKFRYQMSGVSFAPWFDVEKILEIFTRRR